MEKVTFPGFNMEFNIEEVAISLGNIEIHWYAILIVLGITIAMIIYKLYDGKFDIKFEDILDLSLIVIPVAIISARLYYILFFDLNYYLSNPLEILNMRSGGMAIYGAIIGGLIACYFACKRKKINILDLLDYIVPAIALAQMIGRLGNFINVEAYGSETTLPWRMGIIEAGKYIEVHPTFLYEMLVTLTIFIILSIKKDKRKFQGEFTCIYLIIYGLGRGIVEGLRTDSLMIGMLRVSQILSIMLFLSFTIIYLYKIIKTKRETIA